MYEPHCGLDKLMMSWGHDEYLYQVLKHNKTTLPEQALYMIRFKLVFLKLKRLFDSYSTIVELLKI
jgi:hypothetical protein